MQNPSAIILVFDRLGAAHLGPYGGELVPTPVWDQLATESFLIEHALVESPELPQLYNTYWHSCHPLCSSAANKFSLIDAVRKNGYQTLFVTDDPLVATHPLVDTFDHSVLYEQNPVSKAVANVHECSIARFLHHLLEQLPTGDDPFLLWAHCRAMEGPWDAPLEFRTRFIVEGDPDPDDSTQIPDVMLPYDYDPDTLLPMVAGYAAQVMALDMCLGMFLESLDQFRQPNRYLLQVTSSRGFPLGEHFHVGRSGDTTLYEEVVHVPWLIRNPNSAGAARRSRGLAQAADLGATILDWAGVDMLRNHVGSQFPLSLIHTERPCLGQRAVSVSDSTRMLRTVSWMYREESMKGPAPDTGASSRKSPNLIQLFAKPDDRWEFNDVSDRCPDIAHQLSRELQQFCKFAQASKLDTLPTLPENLRQPHQ